MTTIMRDPELLQRCVLETQAFRTVVIVLCNIVSNPPQCVLTTTQANALISGGAHHRLSDDETFLYVAIPISDAKGELANLTEGVRLALADTSAPPIVINTLALQLQGLSAVMTDDPISDQDIATHMDALRFAHNILVVAPDHADDAIVPIYLGMRYTQLLAESARTAAVAFALFRTTDWLTHNPNAVEPGSSKI